MVLPPPVSVCLVVCVCFPYLCKMLYCMSAANEDSDSDSCLFTEDGGSQASHLTSMLGGALDETSKILRSMRF